MPPQAHVRQMHNLWPVDCFSPSKRRARSRLESLCHLSKSPQPWERLVKESRAHGIIAWARQATDVLATARLHVLATDVLATATPSKDLVHSTNVLDRQHPSKVMSVFPQPPAPPISMLAWSVRGLREKIEMASMSQH